VTAPIVGIDLGTTNSAVALLQDGDPVLLPNAVGRELTPSVVSVGDDGRILVGDAALARMTTAPNRTAAAFKRDMGTERTARLGDRELGAPQLSALVLAALKADAEAYLGQPVTEAVVTVPAYFDDLQRQATRAAGEIAGLKVERIINEPTAAALAYGLHARERELRAVVLDLGGGTFDVTVLEIVEGVIEIQSSAGDSRLGGEDFVDVLADRVATRVTREHRVDPRLHPAAMARLRAACERCKRELTEAPSARVVAPGLELGEAGAVDLDLEVTRDDAEGWWGDLLERMGRPVRRALMDAELTADGIDEVLLVGGATRMPCVVRLAAQVFGKMPLRSLPPDEAVAMGAAIQAALKQGDAAVDDLVVTDVAPFTMGIEVASKVGERYVPGVFSPLIERGTVIPCSRVERFSTVSDGQSVINVEVYQGEHAQVRFNRKLGEYNVGGIPPGPAGDQHLDIRFTYDLNGILQVETTVVGTGQTREMIIEQMPGRLTKTQIAAAKKQMERLKIHPRDLLPNAVALERAEALHVELRGDARQALARAIAGFRAALDGQEPVVIDRAREELNAAVAWFGKGS